GGAPRPPPAARTGREGSPADAAWRRRSSAQVFGRAVRGMVRRAGPALRPPLVACLLACSNDPLANPPGGAPHRRGDLLGALPAQTATDRLLAQLLLRHHDLLARTNEEADTQTDIRRNDVLRSDHLPERN